MRLLANQPLVAFAGCVGILCAPPLPAQTKGDPQVGAGIAARVCVACHAEDGTSPMPNTPRLAGQLVVSIAAGVRIDDMEAVLPAGVAVVRAMPNTPSLVGAGAAAVAAGSSATESDLEWAESILDAVGTVTRVSEAQLDAVTGLSGSGPAYVFLVAEALIDAGVAEGLARPVATDLAVQTLRGAAELLATGESPADLRAAVTSPGGTTAAGLRALEDAAVRAAFASAVAAAAARSRELA